MDHQDSIVQGDPEPSHIKWSECAKIPNVKSEQSSEVLSRRSDQSNGAAENYQKQLEGQVRTMLAALQDRTQYRPTTDSALMKWIVRRAAWLIPRFKRNDVQSPLHRAMGGPYRGKLLEFGESLLGHLPEVGKGSGNPAPKLADRWKSAVCLGKSDLTVDRLVRTDERVVNAPSVRRLDEHSWLEENLRAVVETPQKPKTTVDIPPAAEPLVPHAPPEVPEDEKEEPTAEPEEDEEMQGHASGHKRDTRSVELKKRREAHRNTRENHIWSKTRKSDCLI